MITHKYGSDYVISCRKVKDGDTSLLEKFQCEYSAIRRFVREECLASRRDVTYLFIDEENERIIGVCAICCSGIITIKDDEYEEYRTILPSVEIDYFAIDENYRSLPYDKNSDRYETLSKALFLLMIQQIEKISHNQIGATHVCLYSVSKAINFYKRCGFKHFAPYMMGDEVPSTKTSTPMYYVL